MSELDEIRALTLGQSEEFEKEFVEIGRRDDGTAVLIEVREPTLLARSKITQASTVQKNGKEGADMLEFQLEAIVQCCFKPGTDSRAFSDVDKPAMRNRKAGGWVDKLAIAALGMFNKSAERSAAQGKNSEGHPSDKSSSESQGM